MDPYKPNPLPIRPENKTPFETELLNSVSAIDIYNDQRSMGASLARALLGGIPSEQDNNNPDLLVTPFEELKAAVTEPLSKLGLGLDHKRNAFIIAGHNNNESELADICLHDGPRFISFLEALQEQPISAELSLALQNICSAFINQIKVEYDLSDSNNDNLLELFGSLDKIIQKLEGLENADSDLKHLTIKLREILTIARSGYLREQVLVDRNYLFNPIGEGFGPSTWVGDTNTEQYESKWENALRVLEVVSQNPRAAELFETVRSHLLASVIYAKQDDRSFLQSHNAPAQIELVSIMDVVKRKLETISVV